MRNRPASATKLRQVSKRREVERGHRRFRSSRDEIYDVRFPLPVCARNGSAWSSTRVRRGLSCNKAHTSLWHSLPFCFALWGEQLRLFCAVSFPDCQMAISFGRQCDTLVTHYKTCLQACPLACVTNP